MQTYYLNNSGSRWIIGERQGNKLIRSKILVRHKGEEKMRSVLFYEQCGNWAFPYIRLGGRRQAVYPLSDVPNDDKSPMVYLTYAEKYPNKN